MSAVNIDTATFASKGTHATDPDNKSLYTAYEDGGEDMAKIEFCIRTDYGKVDVTRSTLPIVMVASLKVQSIITKLR